MLEMLKGLVASGGQCINLGRSIKSRHPELYDWVLVSTPWIPSTAKFNERVFCILNEITEPVFNALGDPAKFSDINTGYLMKTYSADALKIKQDRVEAKRSKELEKSAVPVLTEREKAIAEVRRRTKSRNPQFYTSDAIQGVDYVECPVSKARFRHIRADHITNVLGMTVDEFHRTYPGTKMVSDGRVNAIKSGLSAVTEDGLTVHQKALQKAVKTLNEADSNGVRGYDRLGAKTRAAHLARVSDDGLNGYQRIAKTAIPKGNQTKADKGIILDPSERSEFYMYKSVVMYVTSIYKDEIREGYVTGLCGTEGAHQIDHRYSITHGFKNGVSPLLIGGKANLEMITWEENIAKYTNSSITLNELYLLGEYSEEESKKEFETVMRIINECRDKNIHMSALQIIEAMSKSYDQL